MDDKVPCCMLDAARKTKRIEIGGQMIGISNLDTVIFEVLNLDLDNESEIKRELLKRVKIFNYVPRAGESEYAKALFIEYMNEVKKNDKD